MTMQKNDNYDVYVMPLEYRYIRVLNCIVYCRFKTYLSFLATNPSMISNIVCKGPNDLRRLELNDRPARIPFLIMTT